MALKLHLELAFELGYVDLANVARILLLVELDIFEIVFVQKVFVQTVLPFNSAEEVLYSVPLLVLLKLAQLVLVLRSAPFSQELPQKRFVAVLFSQLDVSYDLHMIFVFVLPPLLEVLAHLVVGVEV